ncbi:hypothetical protein F4777DRAFT_145281 [Nemania sp. FL0916]|nr:hypothetical protein F4777DRAFT_145281 [Nemania sp. FL0916]
MPPEELLAREKSKEQYHTAPTRLNYESRLSQQMPKENSSVGGLGSMDFESLDFCRSDTGASPNIAVDSEWTPTSSSDDGSTIDSGANEVHKERILSQIIVGITQWLRSKFIQLHMGRGDTTSGPSDGESASSGTPTQPSQPQSQLIRKRKRQDIDEDEGEADDQDTARPPNPDAGDKGKEKEMVRFACPYFKCNPMKYQQWPICPGPGWSDVHRVKEHLYRKHQQPKFRCARCGEHFNSQQTFDDHQRAAVVCELRPSQPIDGFDEDQAKQLKSRKKPRHIVSEVDKWRAVFQILFPHIPADTIPSPFYDPEESEAKTQRTLSECKKYVLRELPLRLRAVMPHEYDRDLLIELTMGIVGDLFREFQDLRKITPPNISPEPGESQGNTDPSPSEPLPEPSWFGSMDNGGTLFDPSDPDLIFRDYIDFSMPDGGQIGDNPELLAALEGCPRRSSDSGPGLNNPEQTTNRTRIERNFYESIALPIHNDTLNLDKEDTVPERR